jgi:hypothetical protein
MGRNLSEERPEVVRAEVGRGRGRPEAPALVFRFKADWEIWSNPVPSKPGLPALEPKAEGRGQRSAKIFMSSPGQLTLPVSRITLC